MKHLAVLLVTIMLLTPAFAVDVKIGTDFELDYMMSNLDPGTDNGNTKDGQYGFGDIDLNVKADLDNVDFFLKLDLDDGNMTSGNLVEEVGIVCKDVASNLDLKIGKQEVPFGQDMDVLITDGYTHNGYNSLVSSAIDTFPALASSGEIDNRVGLTGIYNASDMVKIELCLFQDITDNYKDGTDTGSDIKAKDNGLFVSYAARLSVTPIEKLDLSLSYANQGTSESGGNDATSISIAAKYGIQKLLIFGEYIIGSDIDRTKDNDINIMQIGLKYDATDNLYVAGTYESADNDKKSQVGDVTYNKISVGVCKKLNDNVSLLAEYMNEVEDQSVEGQDDPKANAFSLRAAVHF